MATPARITHFLFLLNQAPKLNLVPEPELELELEPPDEPELPPPLPRGSGDRSSKSTKGRADDKAVSKRNNTTNVKAEGAYMVILVSLIYQA